MIIEYLKQGVINMPEKTFPRMIWNVKDESIREVPVINNDPLHFPVFAGFAQRGKGIMFGDYSDLSGRFGTKTFQANTDYFKHPNLFASLGLQTQRLFFCRLIPDDAATASAVLECKIKKDVEIPQYEVDAMGKRIEDEEGNYVPLENGGVPVTEPGIEITWAIRELEEDEEYDSLSVVTSQDGTITYPIFVCTADSPYADANFNGFRFWFDYEDWSEFISDDTGTMLFRGAFVTRPDGVDTPQLLNDKFSNNEFEFAFKPGVIDPGTKQRMSFSDLVSTNYSGLPFMYKVYADNVKTIGDEILQYETDLDVEDGWMVNIFNAINPDGGLYDHVQYTAESEQLDKNVTHYMSGGLDGTLTNEVLEQKTKEFYSGITIPEIIDDARYPISHIYDTGFSMETKETMINFHGLRKRGCKSAWSTQDVSRPLNTKAQDLAAGANIRAQLLMHPASTIYGTQMYAASIFAHAGYLNDTSYADPVPAVLDIFLKNCANMGGITYKGAAEGLPASEVTAFKELNWYATGDEEKQLMWDTGINYVQFFNRTGYHFPDIHTVYPTQNSLLSSNTMADKITILYHLCRQISSEYFGKTNPPSTLYGDIENDISKTVFDKFGNQLRVTPEVFQTAVDKALGYQTSIRLTVYGNFPQRVFNFIVPVVRNEE